MLWRQQRISSMLNNRSLASAAWAATAGALLFLGHSETQEGGGGREEIQPRHTEGPGSRDLISASSFKFVGRCCWGPSERPSGLRPPASPPVGPESRPWVQAGTACRQHLHTLMETSGKPEEVWALNLRSADGETDVLGSDDPFGAPLVSGPLAEAA